MGGAVLLTPPPAMHHRHRPRVKGTNQPHSGYTAARLPGPGGNRSQPRQPIVHHHNKLHTQCSPPGKTPVSQPTTPITYPPATPFAHSRLPGSDTDPSGLIWWGVGSIRQHHHQSTPTLHELCQPFQVQMSPRCAPLLETVACGPSRTHSGGASHHCSTCV